MTDPFTPDPATDTTAPADPSSTPATSGGSTGTEAPVSTSPAPSPSSDTSSSTTSTEATDTSSASPSSSSTPNRAAPAEPAAPALPGKGKAVHYHWVDPLTGEESDGVAIVTDAYTVGEGQNARSRVAVFPLPTALYLDVDDVELVD